MTKFEIDGVIYRDKLNRCVWRLVYSDIGFFIYRYFCLRCMLIVNFNENSSVLYNYDEVIDAEKLVEELKRSAVKE